MQPCLIDKAVPILLVLMEEPGFLPAAGNKRLKEDGGQKTKIDEERRDREARPSEYLVGGNYDVSKGAAGLVQSFQRGHEPLVAQEFEGWPIDGFDGCPRAASQRRMGPRAAKTQAYECHKYLDP